MARKTLSDLPLQSSPVTTDTMLLRRSLLDYGVSLSTLADWIATQLGTAAVLDTGTAPGELPTNGDRLISASVTYQVGSGGDYTTINAALEDLSRKRPIYDATGVRVTLNLVAGFVMAEQVLVDGIDLSWITITGTDAETSITRSALTTAIEGSNYPAFAATNGGFLPVLDQLFNMDATGSSTGRIGVFCANNSRAVLASAAGVKNAYAYGIYATGVSHINALNADASGAGITGICADRGSHINAESADASGAGTYGIYANRGSHINALNADASGAGTYGIYATGGSHIYAEAADASDAGTTGFKVLFGSIVIAETATGTLSQTANTITVDGIIFQ